MPQTMKIRNPPSPPFTKGGLGGLEEIQANGVLAEESR